MSENGKRSYMVPILLVIIVVLATLIMLFYSRLILTEQKQTTDQGLRLAERYGYAILFANRLHDGAEGLLNAKSEAHRLQAMKKLGEANIASGETAALLIEAAHLTLGKPREEAGKPIFKAINKVIGVGSKMAAIGEHEGPLTTDEISTLTTVRDGVAKMEEALGRFRLPSGEAGFRHMVTVGDWINPAREASEKLEQMAADVNKIMR
jgi:hypothetical protein